MQAHLKIEKLSLHDDCDASSPISMEETELSQLSFWSEPQQNFLPEWGHFHDRFGYFKIACIIFVLILSCLSGYFIFRCFSTPVIVSPQEVVELRTMPAPLMPHKIHVKQEKEVQDHAVYHRHEATEERTSVLEEEDEEELTSLQEEDLPYTAPVMAKPCKSVVNPPAIKKKAIAPCRTGETGPVESYYINIGTFDSHESAIDVWCQLKQDGLKQRHLHELEPMIRIIPTERGQQFQLLAGPVERREGLLKCQILSSKGRTMSLVGMNS